MLTRLLFQILYQTANFFVIVFGFVKNNLYVCHGFESDVFAFSQFEQNNKLNQEPLE